MRWGSVVASGNGPSGCTLWVRNIVGLLSKESVSITNVRTEDVPWWNGEDDGNEVQLGGGEDDDSASGADDSDDSGGSSGSEGGASGDEQQ